MRRLLVLAFVILLGVLTTGVGNAITFGHPDRGRHPNVGALLADYDSDSPGLDVVCTGTLIDEQVFLTAAHCTAFLDSIGIERARVTFTPDYDEDSTWRCCVARSGWARDWRHDLIFSLGVRWLPVSS